MKNTSKKKFKLDFNLLLGLSAVFLSASALLVSIIQTNILREQQHASVWPFVQALYSYSKGSYTVGLENKGVGPAIIKDFAYYYEGKKYESTRDLFVEIFGEGRQGVGFSTISKNYVFKSAEAVSIMTVNLPDSMINEFIYLWEQEEVNMVVTYSDVYGNCWKLENGRTSLLTSCPD